MREIDGFAIVEAEDLRPILEAFGRITWPASAEIVPSLAAELGWEMIRPSTARSTLPVSWQEARFLVLKDQLDEITLSVSDTLPWDAEPNPALVQAAYVHTKALLKQMFGTPVGSVGGVHPTLTWALESGAQVRVRRLTGSVTLSLQSPSMVEMERTELRYGISPEREA